MNNVQKIIKNSGSLILAQGMNIILTLFWIIYITRMIGIEQFGQYSAILSLFALINVFNDFGITSMVIREGVRSKEKITGLMNQSFFIRLIFSIVLMGIFLVIVYVSDYPDELKRGSLVWGSTIIINTVASIYSVLFRIYEKMEYEAFLLVLNKIATILICKVWIEYSRNVNTVFFSMWTASLITAAVTVYLAARLRAGSRFISLKSVNWGEMKSMLYHAVPLGVAGIFTMLYLKTDLIMLSYMQGDTAVGLYNAAYKIIENVMVVPRFTAVAILPAFSALIFKDIDQFKRLFGNIIRGQVLLVLPAVIGLGVHSAKIIGWIYSVEFHSAEGVLAVLALSLVFAFINVILTTLLFAAQKQKLNMYGSVLGTVIKFVLNLLLISFYGVVGAAYSTLVVEGMIFAYSLYHSARVVKIGLEPMVILKIITAGLVTLVFTYSIREMSLIFVILLTALLYGALVLALKLAAFQLSGRLKKTALPGRELL